MYNKTSSRHSTYYKNSLNTSSRAKSRDLTTIICLQIIVSPRTYIKNKTVIIITKLSKRFLVDKFFILYIYDTFSFACKQAKL